MPRWFRNAIIFSRPITLEQLEERIVFDAAVAASSQDNADANQQTGDQGQVDGGEPVPAASDNSASQAEQPSDALAEVLGQDSNVVLISNALNDVQALSDAAAEGAEVIVYDADNADLSTINDTLTALVESTGQAIGHLAILSHGDQAEVILGSDALYSLGDLPADAEAWTTLGTVLSEDARIDLYGCDIGSGGPGATFVTQLADVTGADVWASDDATGTGPDADWDLEVRTGESNMGYLIDSSALEGFEILLAVPDATDPQDFSTTEDTVVSVTLVARDTDPDGLPVADFQFTLVSGTTTEGGTVVLDGAAWQDGSTYKQNVIYTPPADYNNDAGDPATWDTFQFDFGLTPGPPRFDDTTTVDNAFDGAISVYAADVDGDGDIDVLGAAYVAHDITWWENTNGDGLTWNEHTIDGSFDGANSVYAADVDGDGDLDVLGAADLDDDITWWENTNGDGSDWTKHTIDGDFDGACSVYAGDITGDGKLDVLAAAEDANDIALYSSTPDPWRWNGPATARVEVTAVNDAPTVTDTGDEADRPLSVSDQMHITVEAYVAGNPADQASGTGPEPTETFSSVVAVRAVEVVEPILSFGSVKGWQPLSMFTEGEHRSENEPLTAPLLPLSTISRTTSSVSSITRKPAGRPSRD